MRGYPPLGFPYTAKAAKALASLQLVVKHAKKRCLIGNGSSSGKAWLTMAKSGQQETEPDMPSGRDWHIREQLSTLATVAATFQPQNSTAESDRGQQDSDLVAIVATTAC
ncbi:hypothetical protein [Candidatus Accumulibacter vicinus]|uniref:hypothetical protein n=1 Tax=Candidatus Accumulibacter vicinus TaxID=2954382 RepID=UPI00235B62B0|nr:hypothetical protein [Candidatus Accumulibacter vicinus]